jgi:F-type H+-transporting ATPase subunit b
LEIAVAQKSAQPITSVEHIPPSEHGSKFPPFDAQTFASQLFWLALIFIALYVVMSRIALPHVGSILERRRNHVEGDLAEAQRMKGESDAAIAAYERALADARGRAQALANETRERAAADAAARRKQIDTKLNSRIADAEKTIATTRSSAMANVSSIAAEAASAIVERLTGIAPVQREVSDAVGGALKR